MLLFYDVIHKISKIVDTVVDTQYAHYVTDFIEHKLFLMCCFIKWTTLKTVNGKECKIEN